jgi:tetratricopeptide (TPR) repeat protein
VDGQALGMLHQACALRTMVGGDPGAALVGFEEALVAFAQAGDRRNACSTQLNLGFTLAELGDFAGAEGALRAALGEAERMGLNEVVLAVQQNLGHALAHVGRLDEARRLQEDALEGFRSQGNVRFEGISHTYLARIALLSGDADEAERQARLAAELLTVAPPSRAVALALLARALLARGNAAEALAPAAEAFAQLEATGGLEEGEALVRLVHAEALDAAGQPGEAGAARAAAHARLLERAARIRDPDIRERFLRQVPEHAATLAAAP